MPDTPRTLPALARRFLSARTSMPARAAEPEVPAIGEERAIADMLAGCEYEIGQVARDVARTRGQLRRPALTLAKPAEPFAIGVGLRNPHIHRALVAGKG